MVMLLIGYKTVLNDTQKQPFFNKKAMRIKMLQELKKES